MRRHTHRCRVIAAALVLALLTACTEGGAATSTSRLAEGEACPVTMPPQPGFSPPAPWPPTAPPLYRSAWYGDADLWVLLDPSGERWTDERAGWKRFWFSARFDPTEEPAPQLDLVATQLDGPHVIEAPGPVTSGTRPADELNHFMIGGISLPEGCWELTATYRGASLSFVLLRDDALAP